MEQEASDGCVTEKTSPSQLLGISSNIHYCFCPAQLLRDFSGAIVWKLLVSNRGCEIRHCCPKMLLQPRTTQRPPAPQRHPLPLGAAAGHHQAQRWGKKMDLAAKWWGQNVCRCFCSSSWYCSPCVSALPAMSCPLSPASCLT